ncbi:MAG: hypothetical protein JY451_01600 [Erythrobacter sp.]|nr:MAG: hypothetical protein JY451_01600 [Erythrobacter sp.]
MTKRTLAVIGTALLLSACAQRTPLQPVAPQALPPAPYGASEPLTADELLAIDPQAAPERSVELRRESEERADDPFDLPPEE